MAKVIACSATAIKLSYEFFMSAMPSIFRQQKGFQVWFSNSAITEQETHIAHQAKFYYIA